MSNNEELLLEIGQELNIKKGVSEPNELWKERIVYSAIGRMALASLWDIDGDNKSVSITHFKHRIERLLYAYKELYPKCMQRFIISDEELSNEIYKVYTEAGFLYHSPNRISSTAEVEAKAGTMVCVRGANLKRNVYISGLGTYNRAKVNPLQCTLQQVFRFQRQTLKEYWQQVITTDNWLVIDPQMRKEYLRLEAPFSRGYWKDTPDKDGCISLLRFGHPGQQLYFLYRYINGQYKGSALPEWMVKEYKYRRVATALLAGNGTLPGVTYSIDGDVVNIRLNYLLPPEEMNFLKAYSWPQSFLKLPCDFNRVMQKEIFFAFKEELEKIGYHFMGE